MLVSTKTRLSAIVEVIPFRVWGATEVISCHQLPHSVLLRCPVPVLITNQALDFVGDQPADRGRPLGGQKPGFPDSVLIELDCQVALGHFRIVPLQAVYYVI